MQTEGVNNNATTRWQQLIYGTTMLLFLGLFYAWSIYRTPLSEIFPTWTAAQFSAAFSISSAVFGVSSIFTGRIIASVGYRNTLRISALSILIGFVLLSLSLNEQNPQASLICLYVFYGGFCGFGFGPAYNGLVSTVTKWFLDRSGTAVGILLLSFGIGSILLAGIITTLEASFGIRVTFVIIGVLVSGVIIVGSFFMKVPPASQIPGEENTDTGGEIEQVRKMNFSLKESMSTPTFWALWFWMMAACIGGLTVINSAAPIAMYYGAPAVMGLIISVFNGLGRPIIGALYDRFGRKNIMTLTTIMMLISSIVLFLSAYLKSPVLLFVGLPMLGLSYGGSIALGSATTLAFFGTKFYSQNYAMILFALTPSAILGPLISGKLQDNSGGAYDTTFVMLIVVVTISAFLLILLNKLAKKEGL